jgi:ABC-type bacteriocin/lantibiotic exporter with double-glycine peptidase domain
MSEILGYVKRSFAFLKNDDKNKFKIFLIFQSLMSILDLFGIGIVGILGLVAINGYSGSVNVGLTAKLLNATNLDQVSFFNRIIILCILASTVLVSRTVITIYVTKKGLFFLARVTSEMSVQSFYRFLKSPFPEIQKIPMQETIFLLTTGINRLILGVLGSCIVLVADSFLIFLIIGSLFIVDYLLALSALLLFFAVIMILRKFSGNKTKFYSQSVARSEVSINSLMREVLENFREISVKNTSLRYVNRIKVMSGEAAAKEAEVAFLPLSSKYVIESSLVLVSFFLGGFQFVLNDAKTAIGTLALFMAAGARVMPAVLRIQQSLLSIQSSAGTSEKTWILLNKLGKHSFDDAKNFTILNFDHANFQGEIDLKDVEYSHPGNSSFNLSINELHIRTGELVAIVGSSGSGKSTLADLILGILEPDNGRILINGQRPADAVEAYPGSVAYVPQRVFIAEASVRDNVTLGFKQQEINDQQILSVLSDVHLIEWLNQLEDSLDSNVGESGYSMSGGQQQRLGIARALYSKPKLIFMDEATSALDGETETYISETVSRLKGKVTVLMIAHRLSTVRNADRVIYMSNGKIISEGSFDAVRKAVPDFDRQAQLMGL